jgi:hypothetical protein
MPKEGQVNFNFKSETDLYELAKVQIIKKIIILEKHICIELEYES